MPCLQECDVLRHTSSSNLLSAPLQRALYIAAQGQDHMPIFSLAFPSPGTPPSAILPWAVQPALFALLTRGVQHCFFQSRCTISVRLNHKRSMTLIRSRILRKAVNSRKMAPQQEPLEQAKHLDLRAQTLAPRHRLSWLSSTECKSSWGS